MGDLLSYHVTPMRETVKGDAQLRKKKGWLGGHVILVEGANGCKNRVTP